jgi:exopolysaccharide biosynthesis polyprenyl glycosylphosphotransferase
MSVDGVIVALSLWISTLVRPELNAVAGIEFIPRPVSIPQLLYVIFPALWIIILSTISIYDGRKYLRAVDEFTALTTAMVIASIASAGVLYLSYREVSRALFILFVVITYILFVVWRIGSRLFFRLQQVAPNRTRRVLVVGVGPLGQRVYTQLQTSSIEPISLIGFIDDGYEGSTSSLLILGGTDTIQNVVQEKKVSDVVIALPYSSYNQMAELVQKLEGQPVRLWVALGFFDLALYRTTIEEFSGIPMLDLRASAIDDYQRMVKRSFDLLLGTFGFLLCLPIMIAISLMILLDSGWPILFLQKRVGENGKIFEMYKFRTMVQNAEQLASKVTRVDEQGNLIHKTRDDPRITRLGRWLRRLSLDELPHLGNVLRGDMSLVGPRPELPFLVANYLPWQRKRFAVPPGITGWWQISGRSDKPMHLHTEEDLYYIQNYSIWLDVQILVRTAWVILIGKGAY